MTRTRTFVHLPIDDENGAWVDVEQIIAIVEDVNETLVYLLDTIGAVRTKLRGPEVFEQMLDALVTVTR